MSEPIFELVNIEELFKEDLAKSGLVPSDVPTWCIVNDRELPGKPNQESSFVCEGYLIPYKNIDGLPIKDGELDVFHIKPFFKKNNSQPFLLPTRTPEHLYIPASFNSLVNNSKYLIVTEGEKNAEILSKIGIPALGIHRILSEPTEEKWFEELKQIVFKVNKKILILLGSTLNPNEHICNKPILIKTKKINSQTFNICHITTLVKNLREIAPTTAAWCPNYRINDTVAVQNVDEWIVHAGKNVVLEIIKSMANRIMEHSYLDYDCEGYVPLGIQKEGTLVIYSMSTKSIEHVTPRKLAAQSEIMALFGVNYCNDKWLKLDQRKNFKGLDLYKAQSEIIDSCNSCGIWSDENSRGGGVWKDGEGLLINAKEGLFEVVNGKIYELDETERFSGLYAYQYSTDYSIAGCITPPSKPPEEVAIQLTIHFLKWGWVDDSLPLLLIGWCAQQSLLGALEVKPSAILSGESGSGKSILGEHITKLLRGSVLRVADGASTTEPGIRQKIGQSAKTILLDEAETSGLNKKIIEQRAGNLRRILDLMRAAYSVGIHENTSGSLKGSKDGQARDYSVCTSIMLSAINRPNLEQADMNRILAFEIVKKGRSEIEPDDSNMEELGCAMRYHMITRFNLFNSFYNFIIQDTTLDIEARLKKTWGTPIAALATLMFDSLNVDSCKGVINLMNIVKEQQNKEFITESSTDAEGALKELFSTIIQVELINEKGNMNKQAMTIYEVFQSAKKNSKYEVDNELSTILKRYGMSRIDDENGNTKLFVSNNSSLRKAMEYATFSTQDLVSILSRIEGAEKTTRSKRQKLNGALISGVWIPVIPMCNHCDTACDTACDTSKHTIDIE